MQKAALFIDGANLFFTQRHLGWHIDFSRLMRYFTSLYQVVQARYYVPLPDIPSAEQAAFNRVLLTHGFRIVSKPVKKIVNKETGEVVMKGNLDIELAVEAMLTEHLYDRFVLFSGDSDFMPLLRALMLKGKDVSVYSTRGISSRELYGDSDFDFHDLSALEQLISQSESGPGGTRKEHAHTSLPSPGERFTGSVLSVKPYGIFLVNPYRVKCLLPLGFLGVSERIVDLAAIVRMDDRFDVTVFHVDTAHDVPEVTVRLSDPAMSEKLAGRVKTRS
ncbi:MAG: NYN domain-containing protein [Chlorobi bacterium]|nr:NYN domain-containing protein [Chlorobiota bacterium]